MARCGSKTLSFIPVGIFGGSFDPPHIGHQQLVWAAMEALDLPEVWVIPAGIPVHRSLSGKADASTRLVWLKRMFAGDARVQVIDWEVKSSRPVPTVETLKHVQRENPGKSSVLLLGEDAFAGISGWIDYPAHLSLCDVAVFRRCGRPAAPAGDWQEVDASQWRAHVGTGRLLRLHDILPDISATALRSRAINGRSLQGLVPENIREEIEKAYGG